jgi:23S rRNA G2445 N2-methylase RlmL
MDCFMSLFSSTEIPLFVKTLMGLEEVLAEELREARSGRYLYWQDRGVACVADEETLLQNSDPLTMAIRVLVRLAEHADIANESGTL